MTVQPNALDKFRVQEKKVTDIVMNRIASLTENKALQLPQNYSAVNALQAAWLTLQTVLDKDKKPALQTCTPKSIVDSLLKMVIMGLSVAKDQAYFIVYGNELTLVPSYHGTRAVLHRIGYDDNTRIIWKGDSVEIGTDGGITKHDTKFEHIGTEILGGYCEILDLNDGKVLYTEIMTKAQIDTSWKASKTIQYESSTHHKYPDQMAKRTLINRAAKKFINSRDDKDVMLGTFNSALKSEYDNDIVEVEDVQDVKIDTTAPQQVTEKATPPEPTQIPTEEDKPVEPISAPVGEPKNLFDREDGRND
jgi:recombination protein RecT